MAQNLEDKKVTWEINSALKNPVMHMLFNWYLMEARSGQYEVGESSAWTVETFSGQSEVPNDTKKLVAALYSIPGVKKVRISPNHISVGLFGSEEWSDELAKQLIREIEFTLSPKSIKGEFVNREE